MSLETLNRLMEFDSLLFTQGQTPSGKGSTIQMTDKSTLHLGELFCFSLFSHFWILIYVWERGM